MNALTLFADAQTAIAALLLGLGLLALALAALAQYRAPDFYTRLHALSPTFTLGGALVLAALGVAVWNDQFTLRLVVLGVLIVAVAPALSHLLANAAHGAGLAPRVGRLSDDVQEGP
jgi:multicomponent Na+:H+ antiporter subunit G